ncbi:antibiotic ABC transporter ATP-binding protein [Nostoc linckia z16]|nr:antibiotic ABC transporter ATP-binding protein [Nostoc linckia z16]
MSNFKKIMRFAKPYKKHVALNIFFNVLYALFSSLSFVALIPMLSVLFDDTKRRYTKPVYEGYEHLKKYLEEYLNYFVTVTNKEYGQEYTLGIMVAIIISIFLLKNVFNYMALYFATFLRNGVLRDLRNAMYRKITELPLSFFSEKRKGDVMARIASDVGEVQNSYLSVLELIIKEPLTIIFSLILMLNISVKLTIFMFLFLPVSGLIISMVGKRLKKQSTRAQNEQGAFLSIIEETLGGLKVIKSFTAEGYFRRRFEESTNRHYVLSNKILNRQNLASPLSEFLGITVIAILLWYGGHMVLEEKSLVASAFIAYMGLAYNILTPAKAISKASYDVRKGNAAADRLMEVLEQENPITSKQGAYESEAFNTGIAIERVNFGYTGENVLHDFSLFIPKGKTVALVGQSGSGKSTIASLLTRFYDVQEGSIKIDGTDVRDYSLPHLRGMLGLVTQDSILFNDSIASNVALGIDHATEEQIIDALKIANAYEFVKDLPEGIHTNIGDSGNKLSGGQKQRLSIARAVLKNPPIMILDEATSALDTESERLVQQALENMMQNRTSVVIAHRLSTIQKADMIVVMQKGRIVEQGTHDELIARDGTYRKLVLMQSFE